MATAPQRYYLLTAVVALCLAVALAAGCGEPATPEAPTGAPEGSVVVDTPEPQTPERAATVTAIERSRLPVQLQIPGAPSAGATASAGVTEDDFGTYLHIVDLAAGTARLIGDRPLAHKPDAYDRPLLSPDRARLAYPSRRTIVVLDIATGRERSFPLPAAVPVPSPCLPTGIGLSWARDAVRLAINAEDALFVLDTDSGSLGELVHNTGTPGSCAVSWSPDGQWIVFTNHFTLIRVRPDGSDLLEGPHYYGGPRDFIWSPDSRRFFFRGMAPQVPMSYVSDTELHARGIPVGDTIAWLSPPMYGNFHEVPFIQALSTSGTRAAYIRRDLGENEKWIEYLETRDVDGSNSRTLVTRPATGGTIAYAPFWVPR